MVAHRGWIIPVALLMLTSALLMLPAARPADSALPSGLSVATVPSPVHGTVTNCTSAITCTYNFSSAHGPGWANSTGASLSALRLSLRLPGEAKTSYNLSYSTYTAKVTNNYPSTTYWTEGSFLGTDVNTGHVVFGSTSTNYTATCHPVFRWCHFTYATNNGSIVVRFTNAEMTSLTVACSPSTTSPGSKVTCTVTVTNDWNSSNYPTGKAHVGSGGTGPVSNKGYCSLSSGSCKVTYTPADDTCGTVTLRASYPGSSSFYKSSNSTTLSVYVSGGC